MRCEGEAVRSADGPRKPAALDGGRAEEGLAGGRHAAFIAGCEHESVRNGRAVRSPGASDSVHVDSLPSANERDAREAVVAGGGEEIGGLGEPRDGGLCGDGREGEEAQ